MKMVKEKITQKLSVERGKGKSIKIVGKFLKQKKKMKIEFIPYTNMYFIDIFIISMKCCPSTKPPLISVYCGKGLLNILTNIPGQATFSRNSCSNR